MNKKAPYLKKIALVFIAALSMAEVSAQNGSNELGQNNVKARINADGQLFWDGSAAHFEVPKGSGRNTISAAALWIGGLDQQGDLHVSAQTYRESGADFWPGPLKSDGTTDTALSNKYNKVWKVTKLAIDSFRAGLGTSPSITGWPGNGDTTKGEPFQLAPFIDMNGNGVYEPISGDYPDIKGDVMLWWVFNDKLNVHTESGGAPMGIEVQASAYSYNCADDALMNNSVFMRYKLVNRSKTQYDSVYAGMWTDLDIGYLFDDYIGCDPSLNTYYAYNADKNDEDTVLSTKSGTITYNGYGKKLPAQAVTYLKGITGDNGKEMPMSHFIYYDNDLSVRGNPNLPIQYYRYLKGLWVNGDPITEGGNGFGGSKQVDFAFPGNPSDSKAWSEASASTPPGDRRGLGTFGPFTMKAGESNDFSMAFSFHQAASGQSMKSIDIMKQEIGRLLQLYRKDALQPCTGLSTCTIGDSCVWPGDANHDGKANMYDVFNMGYAFGSTGPSRPFSSANWVAQKALAWGKAFPDGTDFRHADANGDGVVDSSDISPLYINYSKIHSKDDHSSEATATDPILAITVDNDSVKTGEYVHLRVKLGDGFQPADLFGIAFTLNYDPRFVDSSSLVFDLSHSWLGDTGKNIIFLGRDEYAKGKTDIVISRTDHNNKKGSGEIIGIYYKIVPTDIVIGNHARTKFILGNEVMVGNQLENKKVATLDTMVQVISGINDRIPTNYDKNITLYPNPAKNNIGLAMRGIQASEVRIYNITGKEVKTLSVAKGQQKMDIDIADLPDGIYILRVSTPQGWAVKKFNKN